MQLKVVIPLVLMTCLLSSGCAHKVFAPHVLYIKQGDSAPITGYIWSETDMKEWGDIQIEKGKLK